MCWFVPVACVGTSFSRLWIRIDDCCSFHSLAIHNPEVGAAICNGSPGITAHRTDENSVGILQIAKPQIARETKKSPPWIIFRQAGQGSNDLEVDEACELLGT